MLNELDVESQLAWDRFSLVTKTYLPSKSSLVFESSFQKNDDVSVTLEKLFSQDKISSVYLPKSECVAELISDFKCHSANNQYIAKLSEKNALLKATNFWEEALKKKEEKESSELRLCTNYAIFDSEFISKFELICLNKAAITKLQEFYHVLGLNDSAFNQAYTVEEQNDININSAEITKACT